MERTAGGATTRFLYDGDALVAELGGSNAVALYRLPGVGFVRGGNQRYEEGNALGSLLAVQDGSGSVVGQTEYDAYGREVYASGSDRGDLRFAGAKGYVNDDATGMQLLGARYYLPVLGRFLTPDPIGQAGGLNLYAYCGDSPLGRTDPLGLDWLDDAANFFGGWGHALTFGGSGALSQYINRSLGYGEFSYGGAYFTAGEVVGTANQIGIGIAGGARLGASRLLASAGATGAAESVRALSFTARIIPALQHIADNHFIGGIGYTVGKKSVFNEGTTVRQVMHMIQEAFRDGQTTFNDGAHITLRDFGRTIGYSQNGAPTSVLRVYSVGGVVKSAYPR